MPNVFAEKAQKFLPILDEIYAADSLTAILEKPGTEFVGTNKVKRPKISLDGAADYDRENGYVKGSVTVEYEELVLAHDRGRKFRIDIIDNDEAAFDLFRAMMTEYVRTKEIPELDATRFARMASAIGAKTVSADLAEDMDALKLWDACEEYLFDTEVKMENMVLYVSSAFYKAMKNSTQLSRRLDVASNNGNVNRGIKMLDGQTPIIVVPKGRFYDNIKLLTGKDGEEAGGFEPITGTSHAINFMCVPKPYCDAITKRNNKKVIMPEVNQEADAYDVMYRCHHDLIIPANKEKGIYIHKAAAAL